MEWVRLICLSVPLPSGMSNSMNIQMPSGLFCVFCEGKCSWGGICANHITQHMVHVLKIFNQMSSKMFIRLLFGNNNTSFPLRKLLYAIGSAFSKWALLLLSKETTEAQFKAHQNQLTVTHQCEGQHQKLNTRDVKNAQFSFIFTLKKSLPFC